MGRMSGQFPVHNQEVVRAMLWTLEYLRDSPAVSCEVRLMCLSALRIYVCDQLRQAVEGRNFVNN